MTLASHSPRPRRRGFTLVELLVVLTIIGLLMAILVPTVFRVLYQSKNARIAMEIAALSQSIEAYKNEAGDYPPNFNDVAVVRRHVLKRWQQLQSGELAKFEALVTSTMDPAKGLNPAEAMVFWLGAQSPTKGGLKSSDVAPLSANSEAKVFFDFDQARYVDNDNDGWYEYAAPGAMNSPYVYFDARSYSTYGSSGLNVGKIDGTERGFVAPAPSSKIANTYVNPKTYQIISAGQDGLFGKTGIGYPDGPYLGAEQDNITNFSEGRTLQDAVP